MSPLFAYVCMDSNWTCSFTFPIMMALGVILPFAALYFFFSILIKARRYWVANRVLRGFWDQLGIAHKIALILMALAFVGFLYNEFLIN